MINQKQSTKSPRMIALTVISLLTAVVLFYYFGAMQQPVHGGFAARDVNPDFGFAMINFVAGLAVLLNPVIYHFYKKLSLAVIIEIVGLVIIAWSYTNRI